MIKKTPIIDINTGEVIDGFKRRKKRVKNFFRLVNQDFPPSEGGINPFPPQESSWRRFAEVFNIGVLDLDCFAMMMGYNDFLDLDISISPRSLFRREVLQREDSTFFNAIREVSLKARDKTGYEITHILETEVF